MMPIVGWILIGLAAAAVTIAYKSAETLLEFARGPAKTHAVIGVVGGLLVVSPTTTPSSPTNEAELRQVRESLSKRGLYAEPPGGVDGPAVFTQPGTTVSEAKAALEADGIVVTSVGPSATLRTGDTELRVDRHIVNATAGAKLQPDKPSPVPPEATRIGAAGALGQFD